MKLVAMRTNLARDGQVDERGRGRGGDRPPDHLVAGVGVGRLVKTAQRHQVRGRDDDRPAEHGEQVQQESVGARRRLRPPSAMSPSGTSTVVRDQRAEQWGQSTSEVEGEREDGHDRR
jgi:hypothetical protein